MNETTNKPEKATETADQPNLQITKDQANERATISENARQYCSDESANFSKWLVASLLAVNGGGTVAVLNTQFLDVDGKIIAGALFSIGVSFALISAWANMMDLQNLIRVNRRERDYWSECASTLTRDESKEQSFQAAGNAGFMAHAANAGSYLSFALFIAAVVAGGFGLRPLPPKEEPNSSSNVLNINGH